MRWTLELDFLCVNITSRFGIFFFHFSDSGLGAGRPDGQNEMIGLAPKWTCDTFLRWMQNAKAGVSTWISVIGLYPSRVLVLMVVSRERCAIVTLPTLSDREDKVLLT